MWAKATRYSHNHSSPQQTVRRANEPKFGRQNGASTRRDHDDDEDLRRHGSDKDFARKGDSSTSLSTAAAGVDAPAGFRRRRTAKTKQPRVLTSRFGFVNSFRALWIGAITGDYILWGEITKQEALDLNSQTSTSSALIWFASVTWAVGLKGVFGYVEPNATIVPGHGVADGFQSKSGFQACYALFLLSIGSSAMCTIAAVHANTVLAQVNDGDFDRYMQLAGNRSQKLVHYLFFWGLQALFTGWSVMIWLSLAWPVNLAVTILLFVMIGGWQWSLSSCVAALDTLDFERHGGTLTLDNGEDG